MWSFLTEGEISKAQGGVFGGKKKSVQLENTAAQNILKYL